jgi:mRNA interferase HigB
LHIISRKRLLEADREHSGIGTPLESWYRTAKKAKWKNLEEVRQTYSHADGVSVGERVYTVFNISGNSFRLVTEIYYDDQTILIREVLTHAGYSKGAWKK